MPTSTYVALANLTLSSTAADVTFASIPTTGYRDLALVINGEVTDVDRQISVQINGDTGSNYLRVSISNNVSGAFSGTATDIAYQGGAGHQTVLVNFLDSNSTNKHKLFLSRGNQAADYVLLRGHKWASNNAITSIKIFTATGTTTPSSTFKSGTSFALYGIAS